MELFSIGPSGYLLCLWQTPKNYATHAWHHSIPTCLTVGPIQLLISFRVEGITPLSALNVLTFVFVRAEISAPKDAKSYE